jgi:hypothetical protein
VVVTILVLAKANETRLNNLILLIAISYRISSFQERKHSSFFVGLSMIYWAINDDVY